MSFFAAGYSWRSASALPLYFLPEWGPMAMTVMMPFALILFFSAQGPNHLRRWLVHPQLLGTLLWAVAHLLVNSEARSLVLFGGIGLWALVSSVWISVRDWQKSSRPAANWTGTGISVGAGLVATALLVFWGHGWLTGIRIPLH